jgi:hypothetical protein
MNIIVITYNRTNIPVISHLVDGNVKIAIIHPDKLDEAYGAKPDIVLVSKELETEDQRKALVFGYQKTNYKEGDLHKVVMI